VHAYKTGAFIVKGPHSRSILAVAAVLPLTACSVGMAMSGKDSPDLGALRQGVTRGEVEMHLGQPVQTATQPDGSVVSTYKYQVGNDPSAGRAMGHAAMDVLTLGLWEIVGTPVEGVQGESYRATVNYSPEGTVRSVSTQKGSG
jgi:hypothetical protein